MEVTVDDLKGLFSESNLKRLSNCETSEQVDELIKDNMQTNLSKEIFEIGEK